MKLWLRLEPSLLYSAEFLLREVQVIGGDQSLVRPKVTPEIGTLYDLRVGGVELVDLRVEGGAIRLDFIGSPPGYLRHYRDFAGIKHGLHHHSIVLIEVTRRLRLARREEVGVGRPKLSTTYWPGKTASQSLISRAPSPLCAKLTPPLSSAGKYCGRKPLMSCPKVPTPRGLS